MNNLKIYQLIVSCGRAFEGEMLRLPSENTNFAQVIVGKGSWHPPHLKGWDQIIPLFKQQLNFRTISFILNLGFYDSGDLTISQCQLHCHLKSSHPLSPVHCVQETVTTARALSYLLYIVPQIVIDVDKACIENTKLNLKQFTYSTNRIYSTHNKEFNSHSNGEKAKYYVYFVYRITSLSMMPLITFYNFKILNIFSFTHDKTSRALIFKRDQGKVVDINSLMTLMRSNNFMNDPYSRCDCNPPYSAVNAIAARWVSH